MVSGNMRWRQALSALVVVLMLSLTADAGVGDIVTVAGGLGAGQATAVSQQPAGIALTGSNLFVADVAKRVVRKIDLLTNIETVVAGDGTAGLGGEGGPAVTGRLDNPEDVIVDPDGNMIIATAYRIWRVRPDGILEIVAGKGSISGDSGDGGAAPQATFRQIHAVAVDSLRRIYVADRDAHRIRRILPNGTIEAFAGTGVQGFSGDGGAALAAQLSTPAGVAVDGMDNVYVSDSGNGRVRKIDAVTGNISTLASVPGSIWQLTVDGAGSVFVGEPVNDRVVKISAGGSVTTWVTVPGSNITDVQVAPDGTVYASDRFQLRIWKIDPVLAVTVLAGNGYASFGGDGGQADLAQIDYPSGTAIDPAGNLLIVDSNNHRVRRVDRLTGAIDTIAGTGDQGFSGDGGPAVSAMLSNPVGIAVASTGDIYVSDNGTHRIRKIDTSGDISTICGTGTFGNGGDGGPATAATVGGVRALAMGPGDQLFVANGSTVRKIDLAQNVIVRVAGTGVSGQNLGDGGPAILAQLSADAIALDAAGNLIIGASRAVRRVDAATQIIATVAGNELKDPGTGDGGRPRDAGLGNVDGVAVDPTGNVVYVASQNRVRRVDRAADLITGYAGVSECCGNAGEGGAAAAAYLGSAGALALAPGGSLLIAERDDDRVRKVVTPVCGDGTLTPPSEACDDGDTLPGACNELCRLDPVLTTDTVGAGGTVATGADATGADPLVASVTLPDGGDVSINRTASTGGGVGFSTLGVEFNIEIMPALPPAPSNPIVLEFTIDAALIPLGESEATIQITKDGAPITAACVPATDASPGPSCVAARSRLVNGDVRLRINTLSASDWGFDVVCGAEPVAGCKTAAPGQATLVIKNDPLGYAKDSFQWTLTNGAATDPSELGDPLTQTAYSLCLYHAGGLQMRAQVPAGGLCSGRACWRPLRDGFRFSDKQSSADGVGTLLVQAGAQGKAKLQVKGKGAGLRLPGLPLNPPVVAQLRGSNGVCWQSTFANPARSAKPGASFTAKSE